MKDLTHLFQSVIANRKNWSREDSIKVLNALIESIDEGVNIDWDEDAGEAWARLIRNGHVVGLMHMLLPLLIVSSEFKVIVQETKSLPHSILFVDSFDEVAFQCNPETVQELFPDKFPSEAFNPDAFSIDELWFISV